MASSPPQPLPPRGTPAASPCGVEADAALQNVERPAAAECARFAGRWMRWLAPLGAWARLCDNRGMPGRRCITTTGLCFALAALSVWQWKEYRHECAAAQEAVARSAESIMNALVGGIRSHRRLGQFFAEQAQAALEGLAQSPDILALGVVAEDGQGLLSAGDPALLGLSSAPPAPGATWEAGGYRLVHQFRLPAEEAGPGAGRGPGAGGGRGWGRRWQSDAEPFGALAPGALVAAVLVVDRQRTDAAFQHAAWTRGAIAGGGWLAVVCVAWAWCSTVRLAEARGRAAALEIEARHLRDLSQAAAGLAHETRNPLGLIRGWTQRLAESGIDGASGRQQAQAVIEECDRVTARINQFLAFARSSQPRRECFEVAEVVRELTVLLEPDLTAKRAQLAGPPPGATVFADRELFRQALFNLLQNAIQASPDDGVIEVRTAPATGGGLRIDVADRGPGVKAEDQGQLFTPYFTTRPGGTGLGLAIVRRIAAAHGWIVGYAPRPGGGAIFSLETRHGC